MNQFKSKKTYRAGMSLKPKKKLKLKIIVPILILLFGFGVYAWGVVIIYNRDLTAVNVNDKKEIVVAIASGTSLKQISKQLKTSQLIHSSWAFERYVNSKQQGDKLQAGTYRFTKAQSVSSIVSDLVNYKIAKDLFTILPQQRLDQVKAAMIKAGFSTASVDDALKPDSYKDSPALTDKPAGASLEGYLYPDSYEKIDSTTPKIIIEQSLDEMSKKVLTQEVRASLANQKLNTFQAITLASIVLKEVDSQADRDKAAQVFLKRLSIGMKLESDVTAQYGAIIAGQDPPNPITFVSPYNTYIIDGLPVGPIGNVNESGIQAVAHPATTDYLYFVAGDDKVTYFSHTLAEHNQAVKDHCKILCPQ